ncbi:hypothetical protein ACLKA7_002054 [Drosophila subpalustris]
MVRTPYYRKGQLTYTEDDVLVKNLFLLTESAKGLEQQHLLKYFGRYGCVERLDLYPSGKKIQTGCVVFANPYDASKVLKTSHHLVNGCPIKVRSNYSRRQWEFSMKGELAYTEDHVLVRSLSLVNIARKLKQQQLQKYFEEYGCVESLDLYTSENGTRTGCVAFADPCDAATALRDRFHLVSGCRITARSSYSWRQPDAVKMSHGPENAPIMLLNDHCLEYIFRQLNLPDRIHFARSCFRFRSIYEGMSPLLDKSINFKVFKSLTLWDLHDFFQLSGCNVKKIEGFMPRLHFIHVCSLLGMHCINLQSLKIRNNNYTDLKCNTHIFKTVANLSSLQNLELDGCGLTDDHLHALKHLGQLKKLNLSNNGMMTGRYMNCLPNSIVSLTLSGCNRLKPKLVNEMLGRFLLLKELHIIDNGLGPRIQGLFNGNCFQSLEVLSISYDSNNFAEYEHVARLPSLRKLVLDTSFQRNEISPKLITWLVEHKSRQLEHFQLTNLLSLSNCHVNDEFFLEIGKLTALQTLIVKWRNAITDRGLEALFTLQDLREIHIKYNWKISENAVRRLILACHKLQVLHLEHCDQLTDKLLQDLILELRNDQFHRPLPIKLNMTGNKVSQFTLQSADVAAKNIINAICEG